MVEIELSPEQVKETLDDLTRKSEPEVFFTLSYIIDESNQRFGTRMNIHEHRGQEVVKNYLDDYVKSNKASRVKISPKWGSFHFSKIAYRSRIAVQAKLPFG